VVFCAVATTRSPSAQEHAHVPSHDHTIKGWILTSDANVFFGYNYQHRKFTDFSAWESQNWFMLTAEHPVGPGRLVLQGMASLEPFTLKALGSPQVFQTGETYKTAPLIDYQHPHDLIMGLGATYRIEAGAMAYGFGADAVGSPALGPTAFMHRESARDNPQVPLTHHYLDSTHSTPGVLRAGLEFKGLALETSVFRGEEPDENRLNIDQPRLNSYSGRIRWRRGPWDAQVSAGHLHEPESYDPYDIERLTLSIGFSGTVRARPLSATAAWGHNREIHGNLDGYLLEWDWQATQDGAVYGRAEVVDKDILTLGSLHPRGFIHFHQISRVAALTIGYVRDVSSTGWGRVGVGGDATVYRLSDDLLLPYGSPQSFHLFLRWRPGGGGPPHLSMRPADSVRSSRTRAILP
jgi:hypothetical protein